MTKLMEEVHLTSIKPKNNVLLLAQEISFAKVLACNDKRLRDRGVRRLKKWFMARSQGSLEFTKEDFMRIWKGLFYCMWMSDKPLVQEELGEEISGLVHSFATYKAALMFVETFFISMSVEWFGIDQLRMDKFMMLVRRFLRQSLELVSRLKWAEPQVQLLADVYERTLSSAPLGLIMHFIDIFCEELAKVGRGELSSDTILCFIVPFARTLASLKDGRLISQITRCVFLHLMRQTDLGLEHQMLFSVWKEYGFPGGAIDAVEKIEEGEADLQEQMMVGDSEEEDEERHIGMDARAGKVDVLLPPLDFDARKLLEVLVALRNKKETTTKARKTLMQLINKYEKLIGGKYPLGIHKVELPSKVNKNKEITEAAIKLIMDEHAMIYSDTEGEDDGVAQKTKNKKKHRLKQKNLAAWDISDYENITSHRESLPNSSWNISDTDSNKIDKVSELKKRKVVDEAPSPNIKRLKNGSFSVSDGNENIASASVASTSKSEKKSASASVASTPKSEKRNITSAPVTSTPKSAKENIASASIASTPKSAKEKLVLAKLAFKDQNISDSKSLTIKMDDTKKLGKLKNKLKQIESSAFTNFSNSTNNSQEVKTNNVRSSIDIQLNTSESEKNNGWGGDWEEPSDDTEYEIFIPNKKYVDKRKSLGLSYPKSLFIQKSSQQITPINKLKRNLQKKSLTPSSQKKVEFNLSANCSQEYKEYTKSIKRSRSILPFDADKKPVQGLLKKSTPSPINPFYRKKLKLSLSPIKN